MFKNHKWCGAFSRILTVQQLRGTHEINIQGYKKAKGYSFSSQFKNFSYSFVQHSVDVTLIQSSPWKLLKHRCVTSDSEVTELPAVLR